MDFPYGGLGDEKIPADASAAFGSNPDVTRWEMMHGDGGEEPMFKVKFNSFKDLYRKYD